MEFLGYFGNLFFVSLGEMIFFGEFVVLVSLIWLCFRVLVWYSVLLVCWSIWLGCVLLVFIMVMLMLIVIEIGCWLSSMEVLVIFWWRCLVKMIVVGRLVLGNMIVNFLLFICLVILICCSLLWRMLEKFLSILFLVRWLNVLLMFLKWLRLSINIVIFWLMLCFWWDSVFFCWVRK